MADNSTIIAAFSADQVARITGLTKRQLSYWDKAGIVSPQRAQHNLSLPQARLYNFNDLIVLRTLSVLRNLHHIRAAQLIKIANKLAREKSHSWSGLKLRVGNQKVQWIEPEKDLSLLVGDDQSCMIAMSDIVADMKSAVMKAQRRDPQEIGQISRRKFIAHNQAVIAGTRIPVRAIQRFSQAGYSIKEIVKEYPTLTIKDVEAALSHGEQKVLA